MEAVLHLFPQPDGLQVVAHNHVQFLAVADAVDSAAVCDVVVDAHRQGAGSLGEESHLAPDVGDFYAGGVEGFTVHQHLPADFHVLVVVEEAVQAFQQGGLPAA